MRIHLFTIVSKNRRDLPGLFSTMLAICFIFAMVYRPGIVFEGAADGLKVWWEIIFPSLLPFFVASEMLMKLGFVHFIGILLEPIMRPLFNVPGSGGFVLVMGLVGGAPINGLLAGQLRQQQLCTKAEAERLISFTNFATPLFMLSAVAVGMLGRPELGLIIAGTHYLANIIIGLALRFYDRDDTSWREERKSGLIKTAFVTMLKYQRQQKQTIGKLLNEAVSSSVLKLLNVGGFIILFSVIIRLFTEAGITYMLAAAIGLLLVPLGFTAELMPAVASGFFETTIGSTLAAATLQQDVLIIMAIGFMLGWSGLSIHAQVASMVAGTDIDLRLFVLTRIIHAFLVAGLTMLLYPAGKVVIQTTLPAFASAETLYAIQTYHFILFLGFVAILLMVTLACLALILHTLKLIVASVRS